MPETGPTLETPFLTGPAAATGGAADPPVSPAVRQQETLQPGRYMLRHIGPKATEAGEAGVINPDGAGFAVLGQTLYAEPLPQLRLPDSPDFHEGKYTLRLMDSGDYDLTFPNRDASDGRPWRDRFSELGHAEFIEISREGEIEFIGVIVRQTKSRQQIAIAGYDALFLLKKAFEQDWTGVMAPRDVIERYSQLPVVTFADPFTSTPKSETLWTLGHTTFGAATFIPGAIHLFKTSSGEATATGGSFASMAAGTSWSARVRVTTTWLGAAPNFFVHLVVAGGAGNTVDLAMGATTATLTTSGGGSTTLSLGGELKQGQHTLLLESDGRFVKGYLDGQLVGIVGGFVPSAPLTTEVVLNGAGVVTTDINEAIYKSIQPFLMRGAEKGDYVLPGTAGSYPVGGLHGRYVVQGATTNAEQWWQSILAPDPRRTGFPTYIEDQQPTINTPKPNGIPETFYAARWFGAIYLPLSKGGVSFRVKLGATSGARLWIGKTLIGTQVVDSWTNGVARVIEVSIPAATLGSKDGWYPIILEYEKGATGGESVELAFNPAEHTNPGGELIPGVGWVLIPQGSLSPLGCVDARIQGSSFFDQMLEAAKNFGYQLWCEPKQLESGEFPGQVVPRARVGRETDEIVEPDDLDRKSGMNGYSQTLDATDAANSVKAFGSGIADGKGSQIAFEAVSLPDESADLFDMQAWVSAGDIAFPALLAARAEAELALRTGSWENVQGEPLARDRLADTFPLTGALSAFRWRPGDGVRLWLPDVGVLDESPRPILQVSRSISPEGRVSTAVGFRARPRDHLVALRTALREATRPQRAYQNQYTTRSSQLIDESVGAAQFSSYAWMTLTPQERVIGATIVIAANSAAMPIAVEVNAVDVTSAVGGPWTGLTSFSILPYAIPFNNANDFRLFVRLKNTGSNASVVRFQLHLTLLV